MLDISSTAAETQMGVDFAEIYAASDLYRYVQNPSYCTFVYILNIHALILCFFSFSRNQELIKELSTSSPDSTDLYFPTKFSQTFATQCRACIWKQHWSYWRNSQYNAIRFLMTIIIGVLFGVIFWNKGQKL